MVNVQIANGVVPWTCASSVGRRCASAPPSSEARATPLVLPSRLWSCHARRVPLCR